MLLSKAIYSYLHSISYSPWSNVALGGLLKAISVMDGGVAKVNVELEATTL